MRRPEARSRSEVIRTAASSCVQRWEEWRRLQAYGRKRAKRLGIRRQHLERLIAQVRTESSPPPLMRVVPDTNIHESAIAFGGPPGQLVELTAECHLQLVLSPPLIDELREALHRKFGFTDAATHQAEALLRRISIVVEPRREVSIIVERRATLVARNPPGLFSRPPKTDQRGVSTPRNTERPNLKEVSVIGVSKIAETDEMPNLFTEAGYV